jgi:hypothetical protein
MLLLKAFKKYREILRKEAEITKAQRRLARVDMDYMYLQQIADTVSSGFEVKITVKMKDGNEVIFEKTKSQDNINFKTFAERYADYKNGKENK